MKTKRKNLGLQTSAQQREDQRDIQTIRREGQKPTYSWNEFMKQLGYNDLVTPRRKRR